MELYLNWWKSGQPEARVKTFRLNNLPMITCTLQDMEIGGYTIKQNVSGVPVTTFKFPDRLIFRAGTFITVFSGLCSPELHQPPAQFVRECTDLWGTGAECTTVLCNRKGKVITAILVSLYISIQIDT